MLSLQRGIAALVFVAYLGLGEVWSARRKPSDISGASSEGKERRGQDQANGRDMEQKRHLEKTG